MFVGTAVAAELVMVGIVLYYAGSIASSYAVAAVVIGTIIAQVWGLLLASAATLGRELARGRRRPIVIAAPGIASLALSVLATVVWLAVFYGDWFALIIGVSGILASLGYSALSWQYTRVKR